MRRIFTLALSIMLCLILCACTGSSKKIEESVLDIRAKFIGAERIDMTVYLTAESGGRLYDFKLNFSGNDESGSIEVLEPENIAGLKAEIKDGGASLSFDGIALDIGALFSNAASPLEAVPMLIGAWKNERISESYAEKQEGELLTVIETTIGGGSTQRTWFGGDMLPRVSEISEGGERIVTLRFENVTV